MKVTTGPWGRLQQHIEDARIVTQSDDLCADSVIVGKRCVAEGSLLVPWLAFVFIVLLPFGYRADIGLDIGRKSAQISLQT